MLQIPQGGQQGTKVKKNNVHAIAEKSNAEEEVDELYVFNTYTEEDSSTLGLKISDQIVKVSVDSGASCNLMSEETFKQLSSWRIVLAPCNKTIYAYSPPKALELKGVAKVIKLCSKRLW